MTYHKNQSSQQHVKIENSAILDTSGRHIQVTYNGWEVKSCITAQF